MDDKSELLQSHEPINERERRTFIRKIKQLSEDTEFPSGYRPVVFDIPDIDDWEIFPEEDTLNKLRMYYDFNKPVHVTLVQDKFDEEIADELLRQVFPIERSPDNQTQNSTEAYEEEEEIWDLIYKRGKLANALSIMDLIDLENWLESEKSPRAASVTQFCDAILELDSLLTDMYRSSHPNQDATLVKTFFFFPNGEYFDDDLKPT